MFNVLLRTAAGLGIAAALVAAPVPAAAADAACTAEYTVTNDWGGGFTAEVSVTNEGSAPADGWSVTWTYPSGQSVTNAWNAEIAQTGGTVTATNAAWNGALSPGASAGFGLQGTAPAGNAAPLDLACTLTGGDGDGDGGGGGGEDGGEDDGTVRIMALGDSITGSPGCWRALLWRDLVDAGHDGVDFVGTLPGDGCGFAYDGEHEGHGGYLVTDVARQGLLDGWLDRSDPDVVLMHFGTNDVWNQIPAPVILDAYTVLLDRMRAHNPDIRVLVAQIIPMDPARSCASCGQGVRDLNAAIPAWAAEHGTAASPVTVVDQWTGFDTGTDTYDGVHPSASGDRKIADRWFAALSADLG